MTWLAIGGLVCVGVFVVLVLLVIAFLVWASYDEKATEQRVRENGQPVLAVLVMANSQFLNDTSIPSAPALTLITFAPPSVPLAEDMKEVASELFELYTSEESEIARLPKPQRTMGELIKQDSYKEGRRTRVVPEMSRGHVLYMTDTWLQRDRIPDHTAFTRVIACLATGKDEGEIMALPHEEDAAQRIYQAVDAV
ncbi:hypothetical protein [Bremerella sp. P1]|uniref:hypothetical protein n=1 Tax=Bremerella sp. P1 TaxID=3026424 RepID=UPI002368B42A|nr:hypothetical protein [Bremerella sp. P1]WDI43987.1 hypothetical protein PSR63_08575 [Bremerella sp. P1]